MTGSYSTPLLVAALLTFLANAEGFFLYSSNKKTSTDRVMPPQPHFYRDSQSIPTPWLPAQSHYSFDSSSGAMTSVALPVAVPIQAQMPSMPSSLKGMVHNVQLVPCLCPVSTDADMSFRTQNQQAPPQQQSYGQTTSSVNQPSSAAFSGSQPVPPSN